MNNAAREFVRATTVKLDAMLESLTMEQQHDLLDALAGEIEERLEQVIELEDE